MVSLHVLQPTFKKVLECCKYLCVYVCVFMHSSGVSGLIFMIVFPCGTFFPSGFFFKKKERKKIMHLLAITKEGKKITSS